MSFSATHGDWTRLGLGLGLGPGPGLEALLSVQVRPHRGELTGPFAERIRTLMESRALFHLTGSDDYLVRVAVTGTADPRSLLPDEFTPRREVARVGTGLILHQSESGPLLPPRAESAESGH